MLLPHRRSCHTRWPQSVFHRFDSLNPPISTRIGSSVERPPDLYPASVRPNPMRRGSYPPDGRLPRRTASRRRCPLRSTVNTAVWPGRSTFVTIRTRSSALLTARPSTAVITSPPLTTCTPWNWVWIVPPRMPASAAGPPGVHSVDEGAAARPQAEVAGERRRQVFGLDAGVRIAHLAPGDELAERAARGVDRNREADAGGAAGVAADLSVDADRPAARVEQRAARAAVGDRRVDLDRVDQLEVRHGQRRDRAADGRDDPDGERVLVAERAPDRRDGLADDDVVGAAERHAPRARARRARRG